MKTYREIKKEIEFYTRVFDEECIELTDFQKNFIGGKVEALQWTLGLQEELKKQKIKEK